MNFKHLNEAYQKGMIRMYTAPNFYNKNAPPCHLYYQAEIAELSAEKNTHERSQGFEVQSSKPFTVELERD